MNNILKQNLAYTDYPLPFTEGGAAIKVEVLHWDGDKRCIVKYLDCCNHIHYASVKSGYLYKKPKCYKGGVFPARFKVKEMTNRLSSEEFNRIFNLMVSYPYHG